MFRINLSHLTASRTHSALACCSDHQDETAAEWTCRLESRRERVTEAPATHRAGVCDAATCGNDNRN
ncbi:MAG: hypothetical protein DRI57_04295 [Deltaproteobacteria bacterium]|nr:MAG: hypothetical protein DRI57_04295 [Deltaproteobacteria bacterium]